MYNESNKASKEELAQKLALTLSDVVIFRSLAQGYHWNVKGSDFTENHAFFAAIYGDVDGSVDPLAENILKLGFDAPYLLQDFLSLGYLAEQGRIGGSARSMLESLAETNAVIIEHYMDAFDCADSCRQQGIADFLAGRIDAHQKWQWQLAATLAGDDED